MIEAKIIRDSISDQKHRLTTFKLKYPRFIHSEFMTHRAISRNASSSRAIPFNKQVQQVRDEATRAVPVLWGAEQKGMQAGEELGREIKFDRHGIPVTSYVSDYEAAQLYWKKGALYASEVAHSMAELGLHKSICNRIIEPYTHITVIASATENGWLNFFGLRLDSAAEPTMRALAIAMFEEYCTNKPTLLQPGWWHLPFWEPEDSELLCEKEEYGTEFQVPLKVSVARCARVSYESFETQKRSTIDEDLKLYDKLVGSQPLHASPAEHQATPDERWKIPKREYIDGKPIEGYDPRKWMNQEQHGNFSGWRQYRKMLPNESIAPLPKEFVAKFTDRLAEL